MDIFGLLEKSHEKWAEDAFTHRVNIKPRFMRDRSSTESYDEKAQDYGQHNKEENTVEAKRPPMEEERLYSNMKKENPLSNRLIQMDPSNENKSKRREAPHDSRLQSICKVQGGQKRVGLQTRSKKIAYDPPSPDSLNDHVNRLVSYHDKTDDKAISSPCKRFHLTSADDKQSPTRGSYNERINRMKAQEQWEIARLSSSLEKKLERARANAAQKLLYRQEKAREEVKHAHDVYQKLKDTAVSPRRTHVHMYAEESCPDVFLSRDEKIKRAIEQAEVQLQARREKAREEVKHAQDIARRVKAAKLLQKNVRTKIIRNLSISPRNFSCIDRSALKQLKRWDAWKFHLISKRLISSKTDQKWKKCLDLDLKFSEEADSTNALKPNFEFLSQKLSDPLLLETTNTFLEVFTPVLRNCDISIKQFLCAILIKTHPNEVIGNQVIDNTRNLLQKKTDRLLQTLNIMIDASPDHKVGAVQAFVASLLSFLSIFGKWKQDDLHELLSSLKADAVESWVIYLTSVEALDYYSLKEKNMSPSRGNGVANVRDEGLYQYKLRYEEAQKGSQDHIKRIRFMFNRLLGEKEGFISIKEAKEIAMKQINKDGSFKRVRDEVDTLSSPVLQVESSNEEYPSEHDPQQLEDSLHKFSQIISLTNVELVHQVLLSDRERRVSGSILIEDISVTDDCESFFSSWHNDHISVIVSMDHLRMEQTIHKALQQAFFDNVLMDMHSEDFRSIQSLIATLVHRISNLVPHNSTFQQNFERIKRNVESSETGLDLLRALLTVGHLLASLESPARSPSTSDWCAITQSYLSRTLKELPFHVKSVVEYIVISTAYLLTKAEICHVEVMEFQFATVTPIIYHHGPSYERAEFQKSFLQGDSIQSTDLPATRTWIRKMHFDLEQTPSQYETILRGRGFVDEIIFARDALSLPEVLYLDHDHISRIRNVSKCCVIVSALFLHGCNLCGVRSNHVEPSNRPREVAVRVKEIFSILADYRNSKTIERMVVVMIAIIEAISGREMDARTVQQFRSYSTVVLNGEDKVMKLLDNRIRSFFKTACLFQSSGFPISMATGNKSIHSISYVTTKSTFQTSLSREAMKAGFGICADELVEAGYLAYRVIDLSLQLYKQDMILPLVNGLCANLSV